MFVLGFSNFEKSTEIRSEDFSLVKQPARALYLNRGKVFWLFYLPNFQSVKKQDRRYSDLNSYTRSSLNANSLSAIFN